MHNASINGTKATNRQSQKHSGRSGKMRNYLGLFPKRVLNNGRKLLKHSTLRLVCKEMVSSAARDGTTS